MTEEEWFACRDPVELLNAANLRVSVRKLGLVIARCSAAAAAEVESAELKSVLVMLAEAGPQGLPGRIAAEQPLSWGAANVAGDLVDLLFDFPDRPVAAICGVLQVIQFSLPNGTWPDHPHYSEVVRDVVPPLGIQPRVRGFWLRRNDATAAKIAHAIDDQKRFAELPVLADALEDAACDEQRIFAHCRTPTTHGAGCWVLDLLLRGRD
jgi:hypothetical protein